VGSFGGRRRGCCSLCGLFSPLPLSRHTRSWSRSRFNSVTRSSVSLGISVLVLMMLLMMNNNNNDDNNNNNNNQHDDHRAKSSSRSRNRGSNGSSSSLILLRMTLVGDDDDNNNNNNKHNHNHNHNHNRSQPRHTHRQMMTRDTCIASCKASEIPATAFGLSKDLWKWTGKGEQTVRTRCFESKKTTTSPPSTTLSPRHILRLS